MLSLILLFLFGLGITFFAFQNTDTVSLTVANYIFQNVPLYLIIVGSIIFGLFVGWIMSLFSALSSFFTLRGKDSTIHTAQKNIHELESRIKQLEIENSQLRGEKNEAENSADAEIQEHHRMNFFRNLRHRFA